ncbi:MAG: DUF4392 domain-containing protein [Candidatus Caldarchaeum sp.]
MNREEFIDQVVTVDYAARNVVQHLYDAARKIAGKPLCAAAADLLTTSRNAMIATGFRILRYGGAVESDGLISSVLLARWLETKGGEAAILVDQGFEEVVEAGLKVVDTNRTAVYGLPPNYLGSVRTVLHALDEKQPDLLITVERPGANKFGVYHNSVGQNISDITAPVDRVFEMIRDHRRRLIAFGDGGNEAGMGLIKHVVNKHVPYGATCTCGCGGGIAAEKTADILVVSTTSDFGVYGAMALADRETYRATIQHLPKTIHTLFRAGCVDALKGPDKPGIDGIPLEAVKAVAKLLSLP